MGRWAPGARGRLQQAALELFAERGYEQTTVADIAARAELTERTFFRYFADKREVFFDGQGQLVDLVLGALRAAPPDRPPLEAVAAALGATDEMFRAIRAGAATRQDVIDAHPELQERELIKMAHLADAIAATLTERGVPDAAASLAAGTGVAIFRLAFARWIRDEGGRGLDEHVDDALAELKAVAR